MLSKSLLTVGALASIAAAIPMHPHHKRDIVWVTETDDVIVTVPVTTTIFVTAGAPAEPTPTADIGHTHHLHHPDESPKPQITSHLTSTLTVNRVTPTLIDSSTTDTPPPAPETPTTSATETAPTTTEAPAPPPTTSTTEPTTTAAAPAPAATTTAAGGSSSSSGGSAPSNAVTDGEITWYTPGLGSCGITSTASDLIVAMPIAVMGTPANPNDNPLCGKYITLQYQGKTVQAEITDTCPTCAANHVDLSPAVFTQFASEGTGVVEGVTWWVDN